MPRRGTRAAWIQQAACRCGVGQGRLGASRVSGRRGTSPDLAKVQELAQAVARDEGGVDPASRVSLRRGTREAWRKSRVGAAWDKPRLGQSAPAGSWPRQELAQAAARDEGGADPASRVSLRRGTRAAWRKPRVRAAWDKPRLGQSAPALVPGCGRSWRKPQRGTRAAWIQQAACRCGVGQGRLGASWKAGAGAA